MDYNAHHQFPEQLLINLFTPRRWPIFSVHWRPCPLINKTMQSINMLYGYEGPYVHTTAARLKLSR